MDYAAERSLSGESHNSPSLQREGTTSKKRAWDAIDDGSSTTSTSMSSGSRERRDTLCKKCQGPTKPGRVLHRCRKCKYHYHWNCHRPSPTENFICIDCTKKMEASSMQSGSEQRGNNVSSTSHPMQHNSSRATVVAKDSALCTIAACEKRAKEGQTLCFLHAIAERNRKATAAAQPVPLNSRPDKPFNKRKLNPLNAETKKLMSEIGSLAPKRRRISNGFSSTPSESSPEVRRRPSRPSQSFFAGRTSDSRGRGEFGRILPSVSMEMDLQQIIPRSMNDPPAFPPANSIPAPPALEAFFSRQNSARVSPAVERSPAYSPPPAIPVAPSSKHYIEIEDSDESESEPPYSPKLDMTPEKRNMPESPKIMSEPSGSPVVLITQSKDVAIDNLPEPSSTTSYPELTNFPPNATALALKIALLPEKRELNVRPGKVLKFDKTEANLEAALGYKRGVLAASACRKCSGGYGVFVQCVVLDGFFNQACCSCRYSSMGNECSFFSRGTPKIKSSAPASFSTTTAKDQQLIMESASPRTTRGNRQQDMDSHNHANMDTDAQSDNESDEIMEDTDHHAHPSRSLPQARQNSRPIQTHNKKAQPSQFPEMSTIFEMATMSKAKDVSRQRDEMDLDPIESDNDLGEVEDMLDSIGEPIPYNSSKLDFYLAQGNASPRNPSNTELLATQRWGAIDPRISWPKHLSADELAEKQVEIKARGTRKQNLGTNFGKEQARLLTPAVRREKKEKGWDLHQGREWPDENVERERVRIGHLKDLFGIQDLDEKAFVPSVSRGRLIMTARGTSRQDRKQVFPVTVAP